ncbi:flagellar motor switch protein FliN [Halomonas desiderata]|uniref:Flagellar motor switch protein FliN n=1 Tax=Billgrantia desiderata TaxID=52021 RepID=A0AAW4YWF2_9GAMM|nr:flagellar motor switch protein FliN [Halomonas desiderata]MCE8053032.1 flagellar motor switch protein FliN [Halomonas desiderata]NIC39165.1 flagellar motor switch protein FliN [Halomonas desiderata]OUE42070.1 flagellar motor switch protein FliN [Halomonas desiderata SP1]SEG47896.1 flagellar motor switch protein FliN/FliY [Halomonas desiderata]
MTDPKKPDQNVSDDDWASAMSEQQDNEPAADDDPWAEAMAEQAAAEQGAGSGDDDDPWAEALAEQEAFEASADEPAAAVAPTPAPQSAGERVFRPLDRGKEGGAPRDLEMIMDIPVKLTVELGRTKLTIKQLLELAQGSVVELDGLAGEPMDILINGYLIAQGEVVVVDDKYGIRITEIITPSERVQKLNR